MFVDDTKIYYVKDFLTSEELELLDRRASTFTLPEATPERVNEYAYEQDRVHQLVLENDPDREVFLRIDDRLRKLFEEAYSIPENYIVHNVHNFHMLYPPFKMQEHWDGTTPGVHYGAIIYITDPSEYEGGEIYYTKLGIKIRPARGSIILHPGTEDYEHGVAAVTEGLRVAISVFVEDKSFMVQ